MGHSSQDPTLTKSGIGHEVHQGQVEEKKPKRKVPFYKLFSFADSTDIILMTLGTLGAIGNGISRPLMVVLVGELTDAFGPSQGEGIVTNVSKVSLKFVYLAFGCGVAAFLQVTCWMITGQRQAERVRRLYLETLMRQEIAYFDQDVSTGELIGTMTHDTFLLQDATGEKVGMFVQVVATFVGGFVIAFVKGWLFALVLLSIAPFILMSAKIMNFLREKRIFQSRISLTNAANIVQQTIGSIRTIASFTGEKEALTSYKKFLTDSYRYDMDIALNNGLEIGLHSFLTHVTLSLGVWFGARMILQNGFTPGDVFAVLLAVALGSSIAYLRLAFPSLAAFAAGQAAALKIYEVIHRKPAIDVCDPKGKVLSDVLGDVELRDVCFFYPSRPKELIFNGFSLFIPGGTTMALVGQSGCGKSSVINLIERFYDPHSGEVLIDGIDLKEFQLAWIRSKIGLVSQEPVLFNASIKDNIAYGKDCATLEEIHVAAELAQANDFISKLPKGLDTIVGEHGVQLSGGQKQRVAIARAILKDPRILLLDEATSALDTNSERVVQKALEKIMVNRTTIIVAHRLSTIRNANTIAVLHQGKIVEKGTHLELLQDVTGIYSALVSSQEVSGVILGESSKCNSEFPMNFEIKYEMESGTSCSESKSLTPSTIAHDKHITSKGIQEASTIQLLCLNKPEFPVLIVGIMFAIITGAIMPINALLLSSVTKTFYELPHRLEKDSKFWALMFLVVGGVSFIARASNVYLFDLVGNKLTRRIRSKCFEKVINMEIGWFDEPGNSSGVISAKLSDDATKVRSLVGDAVAGVVLEATSITVGLSIAFGASWQLSLVVVALIPFIGFNLYIQMRSVKGFCSDAKVKNEESSQIANDAIGNIRTVASFCAQDTIVEMYKKTCEIPVANATKQGVISGIGFGISVCFLYLVYATIFYAGARFVEDRKMTGSSVFAVYYALLMVSTTISMSSSLATDSNKVKSAAASVFAILGKESKIDPSADSGITLDKSNGEIEFKHVSFSYPTRPDAQILRDLSLEIHSGKVVALVGESGSGKSTVISLLQRFYNPDSGDITLDGIAIHKFQVKWLREQMGLVSQEPILFNNTIKANIAIGKGGSATESEIIAAARLANAHEFICGLQEGYDTIVGERGVRLSGGQKQRMAIARAIVKNPKILLLDEATSALDSESEKIVQEALDKAILNKTTVIVAHRLSTIKRADVVNVLRNGSIVEKGNHNTLINLKDSIYSSMLSHDMNSIDIYMDGYH